MSQLKLVDEDSYQILNIAIDMLCNYDARKREIVIKGAEKKLKEFRKEIKK